MTAMAHAMLVMWSMLQSTIGHLLLTCFCTDVVITPTILQMIACLSSILWGLRLPIVLLQSKRLTRPVVYQTRCFCINVGNATEQILANGRHIGAAIDAHICAESPSCNGVCCIVGQATHAAQEQWSLICVTWTMLYSVSFLSTALLNETEAFASTVLLMFLLRVAAMLQGRLTIAAGAWQQHRAATTELRTPRQTSLSHHAQPRQQSSTTFDTAARVQPQRVETKAATLVKAILS